VSDTSAAMTAAVPPSGTFVQYAVAYAYDSLNRVTGVTWDPAPASATPSAGTVTFSHVYNAVNQRVRQTVTDNTWWEYPAAVASTVSYFPAQN
jgi:hypothetical protein